MLEGAKRQCDFLFVALQTYPASNRSEKNSPTQSLVERYVQLKCCLHVDEIVPDATEQDLEGILQSFKLHISIVGDEYRQKSFTGLTCCEEKGIELYFNGRDHRFSSSSLRKVVADKENNKGILEV
jgi:glycerol-3-phosphate cytidylyltransferase